MGNPGLGVYGRADPGVVWEFELGEPRGELGQEQKIPLRVLPDAVQHRLDPFRRDPLPE